jgi:hypothetical protein
MLSLFTPFTRGTSTQYVYTLSYIFENRGITDFELTQEDVSIPLFMNTSWQTVKLEEVDQAYTVKTIDNDGNSGAVVGINRLLLSGQEQSFTAKYTISSLEQDRPRFELDEAQGYDMIPLNVIEEFTLSTETFTADDPRFKELASSIVLGEDTVLGSVVSLVEYIVENTTYCNFEVPQYPSKTLEDQLGDCDDQSILLITLCRSIDIPAYLQVGVYIHPSIDDKDTNWNGHLINEADGVGWHGWAMIFIPPWGWVPVDLTLVDSESGLELIRNAPEYNANIIPALNVSNQSYIGETLATRERIQNSSLYVTVSDEAHEVYSANNPSQNYILLGLGAALLITIGLMFYSGTRQ